MHATSKTSGMSVFHHMLRRPSRDDEQVLDLFKCIYEDEPLKERVSLPPLTALKCDRGQTLAFYAAAYGHPKCLKWILEQIGTPYAFCIPGCGATLPCYIVVAASFHTGPDSSAHAMQATSRLRHEMREHPLGRQEF